METSEVKYSDGNVGRYMSVCGLTYPEKMISTRFPNGDLESHVKTVRNIDVRQDDVLLCTYVKSGTHWVWEIVSMLLRGEAEYDVNCKEVAMLDFNTKEQTDSLPSPRILNTHFPLNLIPKGFIKQRRKIVHVQRNPKDVTVSYYHHAKRLKHYNFKGSFSDFIPLITGKHGFYIHYSWFDYVKEFEQFSVTHPDFPIHNMYFEDLKQDPVHEIENLARFLGVKYDQNLLSAIASKCEFDNLKKATEELKNDLMKQHSLTGSFSMYRKGVVGDWKNWFTVEESEEFDRIYQEKMSDSSLRFKFGINDHTPQF